MRRTRTKLALCLAASAAGAVGCKGVERFDTGSDSFYCLESIGDAFAESGLTSTDGGTSEPVTPPLRLALTIDSRHLASRPGMLWSNDSAFGFCEPEALFDKAPIRTIEPALHDVIASVQFTPDHIQDIFAWVDSTCQGTMVSILSLIDGGSVEVRLFKPRSAADETGPDQNKPGFGVFSRSRRQSSCEF